MAFVVKYELNRLPVADIYMKAFNTQLLQADVEQIVPVVTARAGFEKRQIEAGSGGKISLSGIR